MKDFNSLEELEEYLNKKEKEFKSFKESIGTYKEEPEEWKLNMGEKYYTIDDFGNISWWVCDNYGAVIGAIEIGNAFKTREEAEFELERRKIITELKKYSKAYNPNENNVCICYSYAEDNLETYLEPLDEPDIGAYYFESEKMAEKAIKEVGEERIKKYLFGVEE